jgi:hypothetical protein
LADRFEPRDFRVLVARDAVSIAQNGVWIAIVTAAAKALSLYGNFILIVRHSFALFFSRLVVDPFNRSFDNCGVALFGEAPASKNEIVGLCQLREPVNLIKN